MDLDPCLQVELLSQHSVMLGLRTVHLRGTSLSFNATAAIFADKTSNISILSSCFLHNEASNFSSILLLDQQSNLHIGNCTFYNNIAGIAVIISANADVTINSGTFNHSRAMLSGSVIFAYGSSVHISHSEFFNNSVMYNGGVLHAYHAYQSYVYVSGCSFIDNLASWWSAVYLE